MRFPRRGPRRFRPTLDPRRRFIGTVRTPTTIGKVTGTGQVRSITKQVTARFTEIGRWVSTTLPLDERGNTINPAGTLTERGEAVFGGVAGTPTLTVAIGKVTGTGQVRSLLSIRAITGTGQVRSIAPAHVVVLVKVTSTGQPRQFAIQRIRPIGKAFGTSQVRPISPDLATVKAFLKVLGTGFVRPISPSQPAPNKGFARARDRLAAGARARDRLAGVARGRDS